MVTLGAAGAVVAGGVPARPLTAATAVAAPVVTAVDTTGAGDAFVGACSVALGAGWEPTLAVRLGCVVGALSVQRPGTQASYPDRAEVEAALSRHAAG